jgi:hypothetical protein
MRDYQFLRICAKLYMAVFHIGPLSLGLALPWRVVIAVKSKGCRGCTAGRGGWSCEAWVHGCGKSARGSDQQQGAWEHGRGGLCLAACIRSFRVNSVKDEMYCISRLTWTRFELWSPDQQEKVLSTMLARDHQSIMIWAEHYAGVHQFFMYQKFFFLTESGFFVTLKCNIL